MVVGRAREVAGEAEAATRAQSASPGDGAAGVPDGAGGAAEASRGAGRRSGAAAGARRGGREATRAKRGADTWARRSGAGRESWEHIEAVLAEAGPARAPRPSSALPRPSNDTCTFPPPSASSPPASPRLPRTLLSLFRAPRFLPPPPPLPLSTPIHPLPLLFPPPRSRLASALRERPAGAPSRCHRPAPETSRPLSDAVATSRRGSGRVEVCRERPGSDRSRRAVQPANVPHLVGEKGPAADRDGQQRQHGKGESGDAHLRGFGTGRDDGKPKSTDEAHGRRVAP